MQNVENHSGNGQPTSTQVIETYKLNLARERQQEFIDPTQSNGESWSQIAAAFNGCLYFIPEVFNSLNQENNEQEQ